MGQRRHECARVESDPERDLAVPADRIEEPAEEYFGECAGRSPDERRPWIVEGTTVPLSALTYNLLNETIMHGHDMARAAGRKWGDRANPCVHGGTAVLRPGATNL